jgi:NAD(P)-dependent dehydrogenase (short-subunit alcohol dehydrogenase family)
MFDFSGQTVLVTGAVGNLGSACVDAFASAGASLAIMDHIADRLEQRFPKLAEDNRHLLVAPIDLTDYSQVEAAMAAIVNRYGRLDIVVNAAGGYVGGRSVQETDLEEWDLMWNINLRTALHVCRAATPYLLAQGNGSLINVGSRAALQAARENAAYSASKSAVLRLTEGLSAELKGSGIRVNCVLPFNIAPPDVSPSPKMVSADSLADVVMFLASPLARDVTGASIPVYGRA